MVYQCDDVVFGALQSIDGLVDEIRCFDSKWERMDQKMPIHSTDNTKAIIENFGFTSKSKVSYFELPSPTLEKLAHTASIEDIEEGDWIVHISSDERVLRWDLNVRSILEQTNEVYYRIFINGIPHPFCRIYRKINGMWFYHNDRICSPDGKYYMTNATLIGIDLYHNFGDKKKTPHASTFSQGPHP